MDNIVSNLPTFRPPAIANEDDDDDVRFKMQRDPSYDFICGNKFSVRFHTSDDVLQFLSSTQGGARVGDSAGENGAAVTVL